jgi:ribonuclease R
MQAFYAHQNLGHFGLGLKHYCHFTSPIRRYSDLIVHRSLAALIAGDKTQAPPAGPLPEIALHISDTERRAMLAERDASDRYKIIFMTRHIGSSFSGRITGLNEYGLYVTLPENGITGFVPVRNLGGDFFVYNKKHGSYQGRSSKLTYSLGDVLDVRVMEANPVTSNLILQPRIPQEQAGISVPGRPHPGRHKKKGKPPKGKHKHRRKKK